MGLVPLCKGPQRTLCPFILTCENSEPTGVIEPGSRHSLDTQSAGILILDSLAAQTLRNECLLFKPYSQWHFCPERTKTYSEGHVFFMSP